MHIVYRILCFSHCSRDERIIEGHTFWFALAFQRSSQFNVISLGVTNIHCCFKRMQFWKDYNVIDKQNCRINIRSFYVPYNL